MSAEALIGWSEAAFLTVGLLAIALLVLRVYHPGNRRTMEDHANIIFRGEDAPDPRLPEPSTSRQKHHG
jgi:hypothetical protein